MQPLAPDRRLRAAMKHGLIRLFSAARPRRRTTLTRRGMRRVAALPAAAVDPVALTVLAVNRLGPATLRTVANGGLSAWSQDESCDSRLRCDRECIRGCIGCAVLLECGRRFR